MKYKCKSLNIINIQSKIKKKTTISCGLWRSHRESNPELALRSNERAQKSNFLYAKSNIKFVLSNNFVHNFRVVTKNLYRFLTFLMKIIQFLLQIGKSQNKISATLVENRLVKKGFLQSSPIFGINLELYKPFLG